LKVFVEDKGNHQVILSKGTRYSGSKQGFISRGSSGEKNQSTFQKKILFGLLGRALNKESC